MNRRYFLSFLVMSPMVRKGKKAKTPVVPVEPAPVPVAFNHHGETVTFHVNGYYDEKSARRLFEGEIVPEILKQLDR